MLEWLTVWPTIGFLPESSQTRDMAHPSLWSARPEKPRKTGI
jgi:hypothetical protein